MDVAALAGVGLALVPLSDIYYLAYFAMPFLLLCGAWVLVTDRQWLLQRRVVCLILFGGIVAAALAGPLLRSRGARHAAGGGLPGGSGPAYHGAAHG